MFFLTLWYHMLKSNSSRLERKRKGRYMFQSFGFLEFSTPELLIILLIVLLLFGGKKLPELSRSLGSSMRELRKGMSDDAPAKKETPTKQSQETNG